MSEPGVNIVCAQGMPVRTLPLARTLGLAGFGVREAESAVELIHLAEAMPDLIVLEDSLPDRPAPEVLRQLKETPETSAIPVLLLGTPSEPVELGEREADGYLSGRPEPAEVLAWVRALIRQKDSQRMESLGRITAGIAHDFNNLLTVILGHAQLLASNVPASSPDAELADIIGRSAETAARLAGQMLALARRQPLQQVPVGLNILVEDLVPLLQRAFSSCIRFEVLAGTALPLVWGVPSQIMQVLLNLCLNARDAMPDGGRLSVTTDVVSTSEGRWVRLRVADTGTGIPADALPRIFEPYFTTRPGEGSGLGLATVQRIVRQHRGWVDCHSDCGQGSCFDVYFPAM